MPDFLIPLACAVIVAIVVIGVYSVTKPIRPVNYRSVNVRDNVRRA